MAVTETRAGKKRPVCDTPIDELRRELIEEHDGWPVKVEALSDADVKKAVRYFRDKLRASRTYGDLATIAGGGRASGPEYRA